MQQRRADADVRAVADRGVAAKRRAGGDVDVRADPAVVLDDRAGVDNHVVADRRVGVDDGAGEHDDAAPELGRGRDVRGCMDDRRQLEAGVEQALEGAPARLVVADRADAEEGVRDAVRVQPPELVGSDDADAEHLAAGPRRIVIGERNDLEAAGGESRVEHRLRVAASAEADEANGVGLGHALILVRLLVRLCLDSYTVRVALLDPPSYTPPYDHYLVAALARRGHTIDLLASRVIHGVAPQPEGYAREDVFFPLSGRLFAHASRSRLRRPVRALEYAPSVRALLRRLDAFDPDLAHVQWLALPGVDLRWLRTLARRRPTVFTAHNVMLRQGPRRTNLWRCIFTAVDGVVVHSQRGVEQLAALGVERTRIARIPHAVFASAESAAATPPAGATLLFFGLLRAHKGLEALVRALAQLARDVSDVRLVVAGYPFDPVAPARRLADELRVANRIDWRLGHVPDSEIPSLMASSTLVVLPYLEGDASGVLATALGHGRPVVVSDVGSLGELVREFGAGEVVPPGDADALAAACARLLTDPSALGAAARGAEAARAALGWDAAAASHERFYEALLAARAERMAS